MTPLSFNCDVGGRNLVIESGKLAVQADSAVTVRYGDTVVLVTVCFNREAREGVDFLPLTIDYEERLYAAGKIPGGFIRREGRPSEAAILACRQTDRPIRPLLPKTWRSEIQIITTVLSADQENDPDILSVIGASAALSLSELPFDGPIGAVNVSRARVAVPFETRFSVGGGLLRGGRRITSRWEEDSPIFPAGKLGQSPSYSSAAAKRSCSPAAGPNCIRGCSTRGSPAA